MALFTREDKETKPAPNAPAPAPIPTVSRAEAPAVEAPRPHPTPSPGPGGVKAYLGKGSRVRGKLAFEGTVRVDGQIEGEIQAQDTLIIGEGAVVNAQINGNTVIIQGKVTGDINARTRVEILAPGKLYGNLVTPSLVIQDGVLFEGHCSMGGNAATSQEAPAAKVMPIAKDETKGGETLLTKVSGEASR